MILNVALFFVVFTGLSGDGTFEPSGQGHRFEEAPWTNKEMSAD